jgi:DnaJ-class molecular chaperone
MSSKTTNREIICDRCKGSGVEKRNEADMDTSGVSRPSTACHISKAQCSLCRGYGKLIEQVVVEKRLVTMHGMIAKQ